MLIATSMASQSALDSRTGAGVEDVAEMAKQMTGLGARMEAVHRKRGRERRQRLGTRGTSADFYLCRDVRKVA